MVLPPRRAHHKSRSGCGACKRRRVKCDEGRPSCLNCTKRGVQCSFLATDPDGRLTSSSVSVHVFSSSSNELTERISSSPSPPSLLDFVSKNGILDSVPDRLHTRLKRLLHHYVTVTYATLAPHLEAQEAWKAAIPRLAAEHQFVLEGIFAVASLHLSQQLELESERGFYSGMAVGNLNKGLVGYRNALDDVTVHNAEALFAFSTVITVYVLATTCDECQTILGSLRKDRTPAHWKIAVSAMASAVTRVFHCMRGVLVIIVPTWHRITQGSLSPVLTRPWWPQPIPTSPEAIEEGRRVKSIENMWMDPGRKYEYYFDTLALALKQLREKFALMSQLSTNAGPASDVNASIADWTAAITWPIHTSAGFNSLLDQKVPEAWVILAHYAILLRRARGIWFVGDMASSFLITAALVLGEEKWDLIRWPVQVVGVDLDSLRLTSTVMTDTKEK